MIRNREVTAKGLYIYEKNKEKIRTDLNIFYIRTYNFAPSDPKKILWIIQNPLTEQNQFHSQLDIEPWLEWGNASDDITSYWDRLGGLIFG